MPTINQICHELKSLLRNWRISAAAYQVEIYLLVSNLQSDEATTTFGEDALFSLQRDFSLEQSHDTTPLFQHARTDRIASHFQL